MKLIPTPNPLTRRQFIGQAGCAALGTTGLLSTLLNLGLATKATASDFTDYKAMVCIFFLGGNDSYNMLVPTNADEYAFYQTVRGGLYAADGNEAGLAIAAPGQSDFSLLPIQPSNIPGRSFGLHPKIPEIQQLFQDKSLSFVANIGSLQRPFASVDEYKNDSGSRPMGLFSHSDQQQQWQSCMPDKRSGIGWAGRAMDVLQNDQSLGAKYTFNISLSGTNVLQTGNQIVPYSMSVDGLVPLRGYDPSAPGELSPARKAVLARSQAIDSLMGGLYRNIFESTYAQSTINAQDALVKYQQSLSKDAYPQWKVSEDSTLEKQLKLVANVIAAYKDSPTKRQTFFITLGGFDMHHGMMEQQPDVLANVSQSLGAFWSNLTDDVKPNVTLFTASDFGRTLSTNGSGADHAWGGNHMVLGGAVKGGQIFGSYPIFNADEISTRYDVGQGRLIPNYSVEEYVYPILKWFGVPDHNLFTTVFPGYAARFGSGGIRQTYPLYG